MESIISSKTITSEEKYLLELLANSELIKDFYLAGGTALSLYYKHRESVDLDFFTLKDFNEKALQSRFRHILKNFRTNLIGKGTLYLKYKNTSISFLYYKYPLLERLETYKNLRIARLKDIRAMKIAAIVGRNTKKDFIDLFFLLKKNFSLFDLITLYIKKYGYEAFNNIIISKSLTFFEEADNFDSPKMYESFDWDYAKRFIINETKKYFRSHATKS